MLRKALLVGAGWLLALSFGCVPVATAPPPGATAPPAAGGVVVPGSTAVPGFATCTADWFVQNKVQLLSTSFTPGPHQTPPIGSTNLPQTISDGLKAAFNAAPPAFQNVLCGNVANGLDRLYVIDVSCGGVACLEQTWGWLHAGQRYIALSSRLWNNTYTSYESKLVQSVLPQNPAPVPLPTPAPPQPEITYSCPAIGVCSSINNVGTGLLAAIAHEMGHIRWYDLVNGSPSTWCGGVLTQSWMAGSTAFQPPPAGAAGGFWRHFLTPGARKQLLNPHNGHYLYQHVNAPQFDGIDALGPGPSQRQEIFSLLSPANTSAWASPFGATSPDEDFVETYKLKLLTDPSSPQRFTSVDITVPDGQGPGVLGVADIVHDIVSTPGARPLLEAKLRCIASY